MEKPIFELYYYITTVTGNVEWSILQIKAKCTENRRKMVQQ